MTNANASELSGATGTATPAGPVRRAVAAGLRYVADFFDRIVHGIRYVAPLVLGLGACESTNDAPAVAPVAETVPVPVEPVPEDAGPRALGKFSITFYYVVGEDEVAARSAANDNHRAAAGDGSADTELAAIAPDTERVTLYDDDQCEPIAEVSKEFAAQLRLQGTGKLHDGRIINIWGACRCERSPCFKVTRMPWGNAGNGRALQPFRTIAVDPKVVKLGSLLYLPLLEGRTMPGRPPWGGFIHDGCVVADDTGGNILGNRIDFFVGKKAWYLGMSGSGGRHAWARNVPVFDGSKICERNGRRVGRKTGAI